MKTLALAVMLAASLPVSAQAPKSGQNIAPVYEGFETNDDGSFNLLFGYYNRNWEEEINVPVGPDNRLEPGGPDQGQPAHFFPRRNQFVFRVHVPADFGDSEVVWTLTSNGVTERAYGTLRPPYAVDEVVMSANFGFAYWDENGTNRAEMDELGISYYDENETVRVAITNSGIVYFDENGTDLSKARTAKVATCLTDCCQR